MKSFAVAFSLLAAAGASFVGIQQCGPPPEGRGGPDGPPRDPFLQLFDTNSDDSISADEINAATAVLKRLDRDDDGSLTRHELPRPPRPGDERERSGRQQRSENHSRPAMDEADAVPGTILFRDGYKTDQRDGGRPVALIAAALGVKEQVFRDAFSDVRPSRSGPPTAGRAYANKQVLMDALGKHGVTNDRLDEVSNYYRYRPQDGELWRVTPARATAIIAEGEVTGFRITQPGSGYMVAPAIVIAGHPNVRAKATLEFSTDMSKNGRVAKIELDKE